MSRRREQGAADHPFPLQGMKKKGKWSLTSKAVAVVGRMIASSTRSVTGFAGNGLDEVN